MPVAKHFTKQYSILLVPDTGKRISPMVPNRIGIFLQNTGLGNCLVRFENENEPASGGDILMLPGDRIHYDKAETCPVEAINLYSAAGTTLAFVETVEGL